MGSALGIHEACGLGAEEVEGDEILFKPLHFFGKLLKFGHQFIAGSLELIPLAFQVVTLVGDGVDFGFYGLELLGEEVGPEGPPPWRFADR